MNFVDSRDLFGNGPTKEIPMLRAAGAPSTSTVGAVGCLYMDTDSGAAYKCTRVSDGAYTWVALIDKAEIQAIVDAYLEASPPSSDSGENPSQGGLTAEQINALYGMLRVAAYNPDGDYAGAHAAFCAAFGLEAPDDGGGSEGGDTGGDNTGGSGGEDSGGGEVTDGSNESTWTDGIAYVFEPVHNEYVDSDGAFVTYDGWNRTPYLYCKEAKVLRVVVNGATSMLGVNNQYNAFYDANKNFVGAFNYSGIDGNTVGAYKDIEVPADAAYFVASHKAGVIGTSMGVSNALGFVPYSEVPV